MQNAPREHSAILSAFIKLPFVFKTFVLSIFEWLLKTGFTVYMYPNNGTLANSVELDESLGHLIRVCTVYCKSIPKQPKYIGKGEFQICPRMDFNNILHVDYLRYNSYKNEIISFLEGC